MRHRTLPVGTSRDVPLRLPALISVSTRFQHYRWIEVGWGDAAFYRSTPTTDDFQWYLEEPLKVDADGNIVAPSGPGLGVQPNADKLAKYRVG